MKIAIDTFGSEHGRSGFGSYILNFISNLPQELSSQKLTGTTINADTNKVNVIYKLKDGKNFGILEPED